MTNPNTILFLIVHYAMDVFAMDQQFFLTQVQPEQTKTIYAISDNSTFEIQCDTNFQYYVVTVDVIKPQHSKIVLLFSENFPPIFDGQNLTQQGIDYDGQPKQQIRFVQQNGKHFLLIPASEENIYVTVKANDQIKFRINVKGSYSAECISDCNSQGLCNKGKCECYDGFIGRDCDTKADKLYDETTITLTIEEPVSYLYYDNSHKKSTKILNVEVIILNTQTDSFENILLGITYPSLISLPTNHYSEGVASINSKQNLVIKFSPQNLKDSDENLDQSRLLIAVWGEHKNTLYFTINSIEESSDTYFILKIVLGTVGGLICLSVLSVVAYKAYAKWKRNGKKEVNTNIQTEDECIICLDKLKFRENKILKCSGCTKSQTYHSFCINQWLDEKSNCPICRKYVQKNVN